MIPPRLSATSTLEMISDSLIKMSILRLGSNWTVSTSGPVTRLESTRVRLAVWSAGGACWEVEMLE